MTHTPGPWRVDRGYGSKWNDCVCSGPTIVARVIGNGYPIGEGWSPDGEANARLIASAPALLAALVGLRAALLDCVTGTSPQSVSDVVRYVQPALDAAAMVIAQAEIGP